MTKKSECLKEKFMELSPAIIVLAGVAVYVLARWRELGDQSEKPAKAAKRNERTRLQELKNKRRWGGKKLSLEEQAEFERLTIKYWWLP
jgi:hypothetical protein